MLNTNFNDDENVFQFIDSKQIDTPAFDSPMSWSLPKRERKVCSTVNISSLCKYCDNISENMDGFFCVQLHFD